MKLYQDMLDRKGSSSGEGGSSSNNNGGGNGGGNGPDGLDMGG